MELSGLNYGCEPLERAIAKTCHAANIALCANNNEKWHAWPDAPEWQKQSAIEGVRFHWTALELGEERSPSASHDAWMKFKLADGWVFGNVKDADAKTHPCIRPYEDLPLEQRMKDYIFAAIVKAYHTAFNAEIK